MSFQHHGHVAAQLLVTGAESVHTGVALIRRFIVVSDAYHPNETSRLAHVVLPAAQWGEKEWTSTNSERMVSYSPRLFDPPGEALPDWEILARFARRVGLPGFRFASASDVWDEFIDFIRRAPAAQHPGVLFDGYRRDRIDRGHGP